KALFDAAACSRCHDANGDSAALAPPLSALRGAYYPKSLLDAIIDPSRHVAAKYRAVQVTLKDGRQYAGIPVADEADKLVMRQNLLHPDFTVAIAKADIQSTGPAPTASLMPRYLLAGLKQEEIYELLAYILDDPQVVVADKSEHHH